MKTITARFTFADGSQATATGKFEDISSSGPVTWEGNTQPIIDGIPAGYSRKLGNSGTGSVFADAMRGNGERAGAQVEITEEGDWTVYEE